MAERDARLDALLAAGRALQAASRDSFGKIHAALDLSPYYDDDVLCDLVGELRRCARILRGTSDTEPDT